MGRRGREGKRKTYVERGKKEWDRGGGREMESGEGRGGRMGRKRDVWGEGK